MSQCIYTQEMFEKAFVINLDKNPERLVHVKAEVGKVQHLLPPLERWQGVLGDACPHPELWKAGSGAWGCYRSHMQIMEHCLNNRISSYIVFEDDLRISDNFEKVITEFMQNVPEDWEQLYFGGDVMHLHIARPIKIAENVYRPYNVNRTHCFAMSRTGMIKAYPHLCNLPFEQEEHIDHHLGRWHEIPTTKVYCPGEWIVGQHGFQSTVSGKTEEPTFFSHPKDLALSHRLMDDPICVHFKGPSSLLHQMNAFLHPGNNVDANGFDITLNLAAKMIEPLPEVFKWYNWIRMEIVGSNHGYDIYPCLYHTKIPPSYLEALGIKVITLDATKNPTVSYVKEFLQELSAQRKQ